MKRNIITMSHNNLNEYKLVERGTKIKASMAGNSYYTAIKDQAKVFETTFEAFTAMALSEELRTKTFLAEKESKRKDLLIAMDTLAYSIMAVAQNDREILETSGFPLNALPVKKSIPEVPINVETFATNKEKTILVSCKKNKDAVIYKARVSTDQENWTWDNEGTTCKVTVEGVPVGDILYVQMAQKNSYGESNWSDAVRIRLPLANEPVVKTVMI